MNICRAGPLELDRVGTCPLRSRPNRDTVGKDFWAMVAVLEGARGAARHRDSRLLSALVERGRAR